MRAEGECRDDLVIEEVLDVPGSRPCYVAAHKVKRACDYIEYGVVVVHRNRLAGQRLEFDLLNLLIGNSVIIRPFPPVMCLGIDTCLGLH